VKKSAAAKRSRKGTASYHVRKAQEHIEKALVIAWPKQAHLLCKASGMLEATVETLILAHDYCLEGEEEL